MNQTISEFMTKDLTTIHWSETLNYAAEKMQQQNIRHLPVVDDRGEVIGLISDRDVKRGRSNYTDFVDYEFMPIVADFMTSPVEHIDANVEIQEVAHRMLAFKISAYVIVEQNQIVGLVTTDDLLRILIKLLDRQNDRDAHLEDKNSTGDVDHLSYYSPIGEIANFLNQAGI